MKDLLAKLLGMFHKPEPTKPVEIWPFPTPEAVEKAKECCGKCQKPAAKKPVAKKVPAKGIVAAKKTAKKAAKKGGKKMKKAC